MLANDYNPLPVIRASTSTNWLAPHPDLETLHKHFATDDLFVKPVRNRRVLPTRKQIREVRDVLERISGELRQVPPDEVIFFAMGAALQGYALGQLLRSAGKQPQFHMFGSSSWKGGPSDDTTWPEYNATELCRLTSDAQASRPSIVLFDTSATGSTALINLAQLICKAYALTDRESMPVLRIILLVNATRAAKERPRNQSLTLKGPDYTIDLGPLIVAPEVQPIENGKWFDVRVGGDILASIMCCGVTNLFSEDQKALLARCVIDSELAKRSSNSDTRWAILPIAKGENDDQGTFISTRGSLASVIVQLLSSDNNSPIWKRVNGKDWEQLHDSELTEYCDVVFNIGQASYEFDASEMTSNGDSRFSIMADSESDRIRCQEFFEIMKAATPVDFNFRETYSDRKKTLIYRNVTLLVVPSGSIFEPVGPDNTAEALVVSFRSDPEDITEEAV